MRHALAVQCNLRWRFKDNKVLKWHQLHRNCSCLFHYHNFFGSNWVSLMDKTLTWIESTLCNGNKMSINCNFSVAILQAGLEQGALVVAVASDGRAVSQSQSPTARAPEPAPPTTQEPHLSRISEDSTRNERQSFNILPQTQPSVSYSKRYFCNGFATKL